MTDDILQDQGEGVFSSMTEEEQQILIESIGKKIF